MTTGVSGSTDTVVFVGETAVAVAVGTPVWSGVVLAVAVFGQVPVVSPFHGLLPFVTDLSVVVSVVFCF